MTAIQKANDLPEMTYNGQMLHCLHQELQSVGDMLSQVPDDSDEETIDILREEVEKAVSLLEDHSKPFSLQKFYKVDSVLNYVNTMCTTFRQCLSDLGFQRAPDTETTVDPASVEVDRRYMYWYLTCIFAGRQATNLGEQAQKELQRLIDEHKSRQEIIEFIDVDKDAFDKEIGEGSYGKVFSWKFDGKDVAVKQVKQQQQLSPEARAQLLTEVEYHVRMRHPNVVHCYGVTRSLAVVMELALCDLEKLLWREKSMHWSSKIKLMATAARGLKHLHDKNVVHRDVKTCNFLVFKSPDRGDYIVKIGDFGLARAKTETRSKTGGFVGTPQWVAPESLRWQVT